MRNISIHLELLNMNDCTNRNLEVRAVSKWVLSKEIPKGLFRQCKRYLVLFPKSFQRLHA